MSLITITISLLISLIVALLSTQNATPVTLHFGKTVLADIPVFFVVLSAIIFGFLVASVVSIVNLIKSKLTIFGQKGELKKTYKTMAEMQERINQLESENVTLRDQIKELSPQA
jgi:uncharacterized integral membrane protein